MAAPGWLKKTFPVIEALASAGGPLASMAAQAVGKAIGADKVDPTPDGIAKAIQDAGFTPEQRAALLQHNEDLQAEAAKLGYQTVEDIAKINAADRDSARNREIQVRDNTPRILAYLYAAGFFVTLGAEIWMAVSGVTVNPLASKSIDILLGVLTGMVLGTKEYYFGSSAGSARKTELLASSQQADS
jgi:hypothetical protein